MACPASGKEAVTVASSGPGPRFYLCTYADHCSELARQFGVGLEIIDFLVAARMDNLATWDSVVRERARRVPDLMFHAPIHDLAPASIDPEIRAVSMKRLLQACRIAAGNYGIDRMVCHSGYTPRMYPACEWVERSAGFWLELLGNAPDGLKLYVENVADGSPEPLREMVDRAGDHRVKLCLDVGHANVNSRVPLRQWITTLGARIGHVHLHNNDGIEDRHWRLDKGNIDMRETLELLSEHAPDATFTVEAAEEERCLRWLMAGGWL
jgi:sugar phosphate isomerase/epimerase